MELGQSGLNFWQATLQAGSTPLQLAQLILANPEPQAVHGAQSDAAFITSLFQNGLGRAPSAADLALYGGDLQSGSLTRAGVLLAVATSPDAATYLTRNLG